MGPNHFLENLTTSISLLVPTGAAFILGAILALTPIVHRSSECEDTPAPSTQLWSLALLPVVMIAFDRLVQPVLVARYMIPSVAAVSALVCACVGPIPRRVQLGSIGALAVLFVSGSLALRARIEDPDPRSGMGVLAQVPIDDLPIVVDWRGHLLPIWAVRPGQRDRIVFLDDPWLTHPDLDRSIPFEREMVRIMNRFYEFPKTIGIYELSRMNRFRLVTEFPESAKQRMGDMSVVDRSPLTFVVERHPGSANAR